MKIMDQIQKDVKETRVALITTVFLAALINILTNYFHDYSLYVILGIFILLFPMIWIQLHLSNIITSKSREIKTRIFFDGKTGEILQYPSHIVQNIVRQAVEVVSKHDETLKSKIIKPYSINHSIEKRSVFFDLSEMILLQQLSMLLAIPPEKHEKYFDELNHLPSFFMENSIIKPIVTDLRNEKDTIISSINNLNRFYIPKSSKFDVRQNPSYDLSENQRMLLTNQYIKVTIDYGVAGITQIQSMISGTPVPTISNIPINPYFFDDAMHRFSEHGLRVAHFHYHIKVELLRPKLFVSLMIFNLYPWSNIIRYFISFAEDFIDKFGTTYFGSMDIEEFIGKEKEFWENKFILETLNQLKQSIGDPDNTTRMFHIRSDSENNDKDC